MNVKSVETQTSSRWYGTEVRRGGAVQVSSSSLDHGLKLRVSLYLDFKEKLDSVQRRSFKIISAISSTNNKKAEHEVPYLLQKTCEIPPPSCSPINSIVTTQIISLYEVVQWTDKIN
ncbi:hypothetical protein TNCV_363061 [Trichonephila clavipes]|nr:hypothetical protein TNCV_363061 [Trichonephila clavipes]